MNYPNTLHLKITPSDIQHGRRRESLCCPIALAAKTKTGCFYVSVGGCVTVSVTKNGPYARYALSPAAKKFLVDFDNGRVVEPKTFILKKLPEL